MEIVDMKQLNASQLSQAARILTEEIPIGWPGLKDAEEEIVKLRDGKPGTLLLAAVEEGEVIGWCGMIPKYGGNVYELHPLAVRRDRQRTGVGTVLVKRIEEEARAAGGLTLWVGADDDKPGGETSFANADLYDDLPGRIAGFVPGTHQAAFYMKLGFKIIGVMPDANGPGKPDIFLAKKL